MKGVQKSEDLQRIRPIIHLLVTTSAEPGYGLSTFTLAPEAKVFPLSVADSDSEFLYTPLIPNTFCVQRSVIASRTICNRILRFAAMHNIKPTI